jgi:adenine-specific DNA-methyltransferase
MLTTTMDGKTLDLVAENVQKLKSLFPEIVTEDKIDFEKLQAILGEYIDTDNERYNFIWHGKSKALRLAQTPSTGTLRPCKEESKDWETTQNLYIEGDNLEVLKLLQKTYHNKVKMIYIDPPYNTGKDFVYPDDYKDNLENYLTLTGQKDGNGTKISSNSETSGRYHTNWLNMMYPRLRLARNLLVDDGVIFISIDDNEVENLKKICNEVFGEENLIGIILWKKKTNGNNMGLIPPVHDYLLVYAKQINSISDMGFEVTKEFLEKTYSNPDNDPRGPWTTMDLSANHKGPFFSIKNEITGEEFFPPDGRYWVFNESDVLKKIKEGRIIFGKSGNARPVQKVFAYEREKNKVRAESWWDNHGMNEDATEEIKEMFGAPKLFTHPKPSKLIYYLVKIASDRDSIILDFFAGSSTTAHAVMQLNAEDGGNRKFIMVQLPEPCTEDTEAYKSGYKNICEIGKERIRRAGDKIKAELREKQSKQLSLIDDEKIVDPENLDIGFKVFKLDSSNLKKWNPDYDNLDETLDEMLANYVDGRTELDVVYEIMLKYGIDLTLPVEERDFNGKKVYSIGLGALVICLDNEITTDIAGDILKLKKELAPETMHVVFKDNGFKDDAAKTNVIEMLKQGGVEEFVTV